MALTDAQPRVIRLADYQPSHFLIDRVNLSFDIREDATLVTSRLQIRRNPAAEPSRELRLDGDDLDLLRVSKDGIKLEHNEYRREDDCLIVHDVDAEFELEVVTRLEPQNNTALEGLYKSGGMYCTQCEAEGFRRITYFLDRPDILARYTTRIEADYATYPVLLSNGNCIDEERLSDGRKRVTWEDPFPKPSYLFALVAGDLAVLTDEFITCSGREVALLIYSEPHNIDKCHYAMGALKRSMAWDETVFGREYDLDIFMIVAVDDFNMGAMENKGLNIFNASCVLASPDTATDDTYLRVESVVAHEYFHNWSGNRVTCRDWFQLSLKEGFTVFRDAEFTSDLHSRTVKRIEDVYFLRTVQFAEDAGPMAHPVRPDSYMEVSNFYTPTVYEKGAEVVRMIHTILGVDGFRKGSDLYFERHDGMAVTIEDFVVAMEDASGEDLSQFRVWYRQAGTPLLEVTSDWIEGALRLRFTQSLPSKPGDTPETVPLRTEPFHIPVKLGLLSSAGAELLLHPDLKIHTTAALSPVDSEGSQVLHLKQETTDVRVEGVAKDSVVSLLRTFSAPVKLAYPRDDSTLAFLARHDSDGFTRWDAIQTLYAQCIEAVAAGSRAATEHLVQLVADTTDAALQASDDGEQKALYDEMLRLPGEAYLHERATVIDVNALHLGRNDLEGKLAEQLAPRWEALYAVNAWDKPYSPDGVSAARRQLRNLALHYLSLGPEDAQTQHDRLRMHLTTADNLTDRLAALRGILKNKSFPEVQRRHLLDEFFHQWQHEKLVVDQWFALQAANDQPGGLERVLELEQHPAFDMTNPNRARSLYAVFCSRNHVNFHRADGEGYAFLADRVLSVDKLNPQLAARLLIPLTRWRRFGPEPQKLMRQAMERIHQAGSLSKDVYEVVTKSLA